MMQSNWISLTAMPEARFGHGSCMWNNFVYVAGGGTDIARPFTPVGTVKFAKVDAVNKLGDWLVAAPDVVARTGCAVIAANGYLYVMGGEDGEAVQTYFSDIQVGLIQQNGTVNSWRSLSLPDAMADFGVFVFNNSLYLMGGNNAAGAMNQIWKSVLNADGSLNAWKMVGLMPVAGSYQNAVACNDGFVYATLETSMDIFKLEADGSLVYKRSEALQFSRVGHVMMALGDTLTMLGGFDGSDVLSTNKLVRVSPNGTLVSRVYDGPSMNAIRQSAAVAHAPGTGTQLIVSGGHDGADPLASVEENEWNRFVGETDIQKSTV